ncbi:MAG: DNA-binding protein [Acidobacteria bacterium]|nr:DNA-binding protein [Acidobacteriota bacterium]
MKVKKVALGYLIRLDKGEDVLSSLKKFVVENEIKSGVIFGIGTIDNVKLSYYEPEEKKYFHKEFKGSCELGNLTANISYLNGEPLIHAHATISSSDLSAYTGHLSSARIALTGEFLVLTFDFELTRKYDPDTGLNLWNL